MFTRLYYSVYVLLALSAVRVRPADYGTTATPYTDDYGDYSNYDDKEETTSGMECYDCRGDLESNCYTGEEPAYTFSDDSSSTMTKAQCEVGESCVKTLNKYHSGQGVVERRCEKKYGDGCNVVDDYLGYTYEVCACSSPFCNSTPDVGHTNTSLVVCLLWVGVRLLVALL